MSDREKIQALEYLCSAADKEVLRLGDISGRVLLETVKMVLEGRVSDG